jgi:hypothetical protein
MSHQCLADAFAPAEARYKAAVMGDTWGHLAPKRNKIYRGHLIFAVGCFGSDYLNPTAIECEFRGLDSSPWFFDAVCEFMQSLDTEEGGVYRWDGTFRNYEFTGTVKRLKLEGGDPCSLK